MVEDSRNRFRAGDVIALRYVTTDGRIEMCWPCRAVADDNDILALFIKAGSPYRAAPKMTAAEKRAARLPATPPDEYSWRQDTLRLMFPGRHHSVFLFWKTADGKRSFTRYFVNMEEPFRRTAVGVDTQDHTLDIDVTPELRCSWRDEDELANHVKYGFYTQALARAARAEGESVIDAITRGTHPCLNGWDRWRPDPAWRIPAFPNGWDSVPATSWERRVWAYGEDRQ
jgi:predicted RNA-binding protein associated with RNAse of E/G family